MDKNVGGADRTARLGVGAILVIAAVAGLAGSLQLGLTVGLLGLLVGAILLGTGATQRCLINQAAGRNTFER